MMHSFQQIVTQAERRYNFVVHGLAPLGDEMGVSPLMWRKKPMDSISGNLGYICNGFHAWQTRLASPRTPRQTGGELAVRSTKDGRMTMLTSRPVIFFTLF